MSDKRTNNDAGLGPLRPSAPDPVVAPPATPDDHSGWTPQQIHDGAHTWHHDDVQALAAAIHGTGAPCDRCLTLAAHTVRTVTTNPDEVLAILPVAPGGLPDRIEALAAEWVQRASISAGSESYMTLQDCISDLRAALSAETPK